MTRPYISPAILARLVPGHALKEETVEPTHLLAALAFSLVLIGSLVGLGRDLWRNRGQIVRALKREAR